MSDEPAEAAKESPIEPKEEIEKVELSEDDIQWIKNQRAIKVQPRPEPDDEPTIEEVAILKTEKVEVRAEPDAPINQPKPKKSNKQLLKERRTRTLQLVRK
jgi:hypothetical protein